MMFHKLRRRVGAKLRSHKGLSLLELLLTTVILLLITQIMADGIPVVIRLYRRTVDTANAQAYLSTTMIALRSKLSVASGVDIVDNKPTYFLDPEKGYYKITNDQDKGIQIQYFDVNKEPRKYFDKDKNENVPYEPLPLLQSVTKAQNETNTLISACGDIEITSDGETFTITDLKVVSKDDPSTALAELKEEFIVHTVNP